MSRLRRPSVAVAVGLLVVVLVRAWSTGRIATPWILIDELLYADLARSVATEGQLAVRGEPMRTSVLYPLLIAPAWLADDMETTYRVAKWINVLAMSAVALPVFLWAQRLAGKRAGVVAAGLTLLLPAFVYTGSLLTANLFLPLFVGAAYALAGALESPTPARWLVVVAAVVAATATRAQGLVLLPVIATAVVTFAVFERRAPRRLAVWTGLAAVAAAVVVLVTRSVPGLDDRRLEGLLEHDYAAGEVARWLAFNAGGFVLASGVLPALALVLLAGRATSRAERAFLAVALSASVWLVALAGVASTWAPVGIRERYAFHAVPLLLIALVVWAARGLPRPRLVAWSAGAVALGLIAALPLRTIFGSGSFLGDAFSLIAFWRLARVLPGEVDTARALLVAGALVAVLLGLLLPRRLAPALPALVGVFFVGSSAAVFATARSQALGVSLASGQAANPTWIDDAVGDARVTYLNVRPMEPPEWVPVWQAEFWNRSFARVADWGATEPSPLPTTAGLAGLEPRYALLPAGAAVAGEVVASSGGLRLYRVDPPLRVVARPE